MLTLLAQIVVIIGAARLVGLVLRRLGQPQVVGEMVAGLLLGPTLLGSLAPGFSAMLFPVESLPRLAALSQIGLLLFMFIVGIDFDPALLRGKQKTAVVTSQVSIVVPFALGLGLATYLHPRLAPPGVSFAAFALFMGTAMSITAFPVLARILHERGLIGTRVGALALACAAVGDVTAWIILALVIAVVRAGGMQTDILRTLAGALTYALVMLFIVRPAVRRLHAAFAREGTVSLHLLGILFVLMVASAWATEWLGVHALFGAFMAGAVLPKDRAFVSSLTGRLEGVTVVLLLPLFFAEIGLRTSLELLSGAELWGYFGLLMAAAVLGKLGGSWVAARLTGLPGREAGALGILLNTRGLMELVVASIGLELGVISPTVFTMLVLMAMVTTFMATPALELLYPARLMKAKVDSGPRSST